MIDREFAKSQIAKLSCLPFAPTTIDGMGVLIDTLAEKAESENHAKRIIASILFPGKESSPRWPNPQQLIDTAWAIHDEEEAERREQAEREERRKWEQAKAKGEEPDIPRCPHCNGIGYTRKVIKNCDFAVRCVCNPVVAPQEKEADPVKKQKPAFAGGGRRVPYRDIDD